MMLKIVMAPLRGAHRALRAGRRLGYLIETQGHMMFTEREKRDHILWWADATGYDVFVETGTYTGATIAAVSGHFRTVYSIEADRDLWAGAAGRFPHAHVLHGDSAVVLPEVLPRLSEPAVFWLDAHCSRGITGIGAKETPIEEELRAIFAHPCNHVVLIDDARLFIGMDGYPSFRRIKKLAGGRSVRVLGDVIRIYRDDI